jgi:beta-lactam-binding protein with PASTA domain
MSPSDDSADINVFLENENDRTVLADYSGMQLVDVTHNLNNLGIDYQISGGGTVVHHHIPAAGKVAPKDDVPVYLYMDPESKYEDEMTYVPDVEGQEMELGEDFVIQANLSPITFFDKSENPADKTSGEDPATFYPGDDAGSSGDDGESAVNSYIIYKQYPSANSYVQKGTEVKLKVKPAP